METKETIKKMIDNQKLAKEWLLDQMDGLTINKSNPDCITYKKGK